MGYRYFRLLDIYVIKTVFPDTIEMDDFMKEVLYGYTDGEKNITHCLNRITFVSEESAEGDTADRKNDCEMPDVRRST